MRREFEKQEACRESAAAFCFLSRHRLATDGQGVTTLVGFHGCPLRCRHCLNPMSLAEGTFCKKMTPAQLYDEMKIDNLYFLATGGGVTFGGGEPLLHPGFLREFRALCGPQWRLTAETSLAVRWESVQTVAVDAAFDEFIVDCKDGNPEIYRRYTGGDALLMQENLRRLLTILPPEKILLRLPLIPGYNTEEDRARSEALFREMGVLRFDRFVYKTDRKIPENDT